MERLGISPETRESNFLKMFRDTIATSRDKIDAEFKRTDSDWFACFVKRLTVVNGDLQLARRNNLISEGEYSKLNDRFDEAHDKLIAYRSQYPSLKKELPPEEVREDLIASLDIFREK